MRKELEDIYEKLFQNYPYDLSAPHGIHYYGGREDISRLIHKQILNEEDEYQRRNENTNNFVHLRSDAKYFLMIIFYQMIAIPLQHPDLRELRPELLEKYISDDIRALLSNGYNLKQTAEVKEVTAHTLLAAMDTNWESLNISNVKLWNP